MAKRQQVQYRPPDVGLSPAAAPIDSGFIARIPKPDLFPAEELAGLSDILAGIAQSAAKKEADVQYTAGKNAALGAPPDVIDEIAAAARDLDGAEKKRRANQDAWAKLVASGRVPEFSSPWFRVAYMETTARRLLSQYTDGLMRRLPEASTVIDATTGQPIVPESTEKIIATEWNKYANNGVLSDYYASRVAADLRGTANERFRAAASEALGKAQAEAREQFLTNELSRKFTAWALADSPPTPDDVSSVEVYILEELRRKSVPDPRAVVMKAASFAAASADATDDGSGAGSEAAALLRTVSRVKVGPLSLEKDAEAGLDLMKWIRDYEDLHDDRDVRRLQRRPMEQRAAVDSGTTEALPLIRAAKDAGEDPIAAARRLTAEATESQKWGVYTPHVVESILAAAESFTADRRPDDGTIVDSLERRIVQGDRLAGLSDDVRAAMNAGRIGGDTAQKLLDRLAKRVDIVPLIEENPAYTATVKSLAEANDLQGFPPDVQAKYDASANGLIEEFRRDAAEFAKSVHGLPDAQLRARQWYSERGAEVRSKIAAEVKTVRSQRAASLEGIYDRINHFTSADDLIDKARGLLTVDEVARLKEASGRAGDRTQFFSTPAYADAEADVKMLVAANMAEAGETTASALSIDTLAFYSRMLRQRADSWLGENLAKTAPSEAGTQFAAALDEMVDEVAAKVGKGTREVLSRGLEAGKKPEEVTGAIRAVNESFEMAQSLVAAEPGDVAALLTSAVRRDPLVASGVYSVQSDFFKGGGRRYGVDGRNYSESLKLVARTDVPEQARAAAVAAVHRSTGISAEDVLADRLVLRPSAQLVAEAEKINAAYERLGRIYKMPPGELTTSLSYPYPFVRQVLDPDQPSVSLKDVQLDPYTTPFFKSVDELRTWRESRRDDLLRLTQRLGLATDQATVDEWVKFQVDAIERAYPNNR